MIWQCAPQTVAGHMQCSDVVRPHVWSWPGWKLLSKDRPWALERLLTRTVSTDDGDNRSCQWRQLKKSDNKCRTALTWPGWKLLSKDHAHWRGCYKNNIDRWWQQLILPMTAVKDKWQQMNCTNRSTHSESQKELPKKYSLNFKRAVWHRNMPAFYTPNI